MLLSIDLLAAALVSLSAAVTFFSLQSAFERWRETRPWMLAMLGPLLFGGALGIAIGMRYLSSLTVEFSNYVVTVPLPSFVGRPLSLSIPSIPMINALAISSIVMIAAIAESAFSFVAARAGLNDTARHRREVRQMPHFGRPAEWACAGTVSVASYKIVVATLAGGDEVSLTSDQIGVALLLQALIMLAFLALFIARYGVAEWHQRRLWFTGGLRSGEELHPFWPRVPSLALVGSATLGWFVMTVAIWL
jgi:hypothetical protein